MRTKTTYSLLVIFLWAMQIQAAEIYLPTVAQRTYAASYNSYGDRFKFNMEYTYDDYGHLILEKRYFEHEGSYVLTDSIVREYHLLPSGKYVLVKDEHKGMQLHHRMSWDAEKQEPIPEIIFEPYHYRETAAYDERGMQLYERNEYFDVSSQQWKINSSTRAVVNASGIRTKVEEYDADSRTWKTKPYTFDTQGRILSYTYVVNGGEEYTWGEDGFLSGITMSDGDSKMSLQNITTALNREYFEPYSLMSEVQTFDAMNTDFHFRDIQEYAWNDYTLKKWMYNADVIRNGEHGSFIVLVSEAENEIAQVGVIDGTEFYRNFYKLLPNGGWANCHIVDGDTVDVRIKEYGQNGALIREYNWNNPSGVPDNPFISEYENIYIRRYDAQGRPTKTSHNDFEETYTAWIKLNDQQASVRETTTPELMLYPNPASDYVTIKSDSDILRIDIYNQSGVCVQHENNPAHMINVSNLSGVYFVRIHPKGEAPVVQKLIVE